ncbi:hypothetical protein AVEN_72458-1 [Araneus ventricosus]|uniref:Integrase catalytic domain-containing protein n=1 Tax=Araneus ventricosus TaxID=182803 RepID=A0A4Y2HPM3_ARAVE|nr:hypothetical protein AVEN_72458-1 [Araneus ventricosus]
MNRVVYGITCAPYLAQRVLKQFVMDDGHNYPLATSAVSSDMYMDDLLTGAADIYSAKQLKEQLRALFRGGDMQLHKWSSNCKELLSNSEVPDGDVSLTIPDETKALGLLWRSQKDSLAFSVSANVDTCESCKITKRSVLSTTARIFDPLGLISPVAKLVIQELWRLKLDWNDSLPMQLESQWKRFVTFLSTINTRNIPRYIFLDYALKLELNGFADASEKAYGAAIYVRCLSNSGEISTNLLCSKSRFSPLKSVTIPRLQLCAAVLLVKLAQKTIISMKISFYSTVLWTNSNIVLVWIQKDFSVLKPFVRNRVNAIQNLTEISAWKHVLFKENPADVISRGIDPEKIEDCNLWWFGPSFLQDHSVVSPCVYSDIKDNELYQREFKEISSVSCGARTRSVTYNQQLFFIYPTSTSHRVVDLKNRINIFICFVVKSVHLEIVNSCSTDAFIGALKRFIALRGKPSVIYSDNGTNFVGANNELRKILKDLFNKESTEKIEDSIASEGIVWHFNPPATPHFGGLWEAGVKSLKSHLKRVVGNTVLTHEEFSTLVTQVEAVLNSRPLCNLPSDPNDDFVLTPAHFLVGSSLTALPDPDLTEVPINRLNRWQLVQRLSQIFWKKWSSDY